MPHFFCPGINFSSNPVFLTDQEEIHHLRHVLRLKKGDAVSLFNGDGQQADGTIDAFHPEKIVVYISSVKKSKRKIPLIVLACAMPKKGKFETIIEKVTELGADEIIPVKTARTEVKLDRQRLNQKRLRYQTVAINAAKQSQRSTLPVIHPIMSFSDALDYLSANSTVIIPSLVGQRENLFQGLSKIQKPKKISFLIGPEGDFTSQEYKLARERGCMAVTLGETVLKVETAAITAVGCANLFFARPDT